MRYSVTSCRIRTYHTEHTLNLWIGHVAFFHLNVAVENECTTHDRVSDEISRELATGNGMKKSVHGTIHAKQLQRKNYFSQKVYYSACLLPLLRLHVWPFVSKTQHLHLLHRPTLERDHFSLLAPKASRTQPIYHHP